MCDNVSTALVGSRVCVRVADSGGGGCYFGTVFRVQAVGATRRITLHSVRWLAPTTTTTTSATCTATGRTTPAATGSGYDESEAQPVCGVQEFDSCELVSVTVVDGQAESETDACLTGVSAGLADKAVRVGKSRDTMLMSSHGSSGPARSSTAAAPSAGGSASSTAKRPPTSLMDKSLLLSEMSLEDNEENVQPVGDDVTCHVIDSSWSRRDITSLVTLLCSRQRVGVSAEGVLIGRHGTLSLLCFYSDVDNTVHCVDVVSCDRKIDDSKAEGDHTAAAAETQCNTPVKSIVDEFSAVLQSRRVQKVIHDSRCLSDLLYHRYGVRLANVFDTQAAEVLLYRRQHGALPTFVTNVAHTLVSRLNLPPSQVFFPRYRVERLAEDQSAWMQRPLVQHLVTGAIYNCRHLLSLACRQMELMWADYNRCVQVYLNCVSRADDEDASNAPFESHRLPVGVCSIIGEKSSKSDCNGVMPSGSIANVLPGLDRAFQFTRNVWNGQTAPAKLANK